MDRQSEPPQARNIAVIIAHGVGEADPGYAAATLSKTLGKCGGFAPDDAIQVRHLPDPRWPETGITFPVYVGGGRLADGTRLTLAELYWADLSKIGSSRIDAFLGFFRIIFESHHLVDGMLQGARGYGARLLRHFLLFASFLLRGPIIGLVVPILAFLAAALYLPPSILKYLSEPVLFGLVSAMVLFISGWLFYRVLKRRESTWYDTVLWTGLVAATLVVGFAAVYILDIPIVSGCPRWPGMAQDCRQNYIDFVYGYLGYLWLTWGGTILACFAIALSVAAWWRRRDPQNAPPVLTALGVVLMQFLLWTALMGLVAMPLIYRVEEVKGAYALHLDERDDAERRKVSRPPLPKVAAYPAARKLFDVVPWHPDRASWVERLSFGYAMNGIIILCVLLAGWATHVRRSRAARRLAEAGRQPESGPPGGKGLEPAGTQGGIGKNGSGEAESIPRMLVGHGILITLMVLTFFQALYLLLQLDLNLFLPEAGGWRRYFLALGWIATLLLSLAVSYRVSNFVHIARDLIDHQFTYRRASALTRLKKANMAEVWPRRARIRARLEKVFDDLVRTGKFDHVVFAVHSQGSVIAFDYLKDKASTIKEMCGSPPDVVTFGSPLSHLYQHYFVEYRALDEDIASLGGDIGRWVNIFRIDDYIGTMVAPGKNSRVVNRPIGSGGHTDYWREDDLGRAILEACCPAPAITANNATAGQ